MRHSCAGTIRPLHHNPCWKADGLKNSFRLMRIAAVVAAMVLIAAACSDGSTDQESAPLASDSAEPAPVSPDDNVGDTPRTTGVCAPDVPNCNDTLVVGGRGPLTLPDDEPPSPTGDPEPVGRGGGGTVTSGGMLVDGGLSVTDALSTDASGVIAVQGHLFDDGSGLRLCWGLAESLPPLCMEPSIAVRGFDSGDTALEQAQGVLWTNTAVTLFGELLIDGVFAVNDLVTG